MVAIGSSSSSPIFSSISDTTHKLSDIRYQLMEEAEKMQKAKREAQLQSEQEVQVFEKTVRKSPYATPSAATDIGALIQNTSRLNVFGALNKNDKVDFLKFRLQPSGEPKFLLTSDPGVRVQIMTRHGAVVADSDEKSGKDYENYGKLQAGELRMNAGEYLIKLTRTDEAEKGQSVRYAIQMKMGVYSKDFDTRVAQPRAGDGMPKTPQAQLELQNMLNASAQFVNSLPPIGTSATYKLMGTLYNGIV